MLLNKKCEDMATAMSFINSLNRQCKTLSYLSGKESSEEELNKSIGIIHSELEDMISSRFITRGNSGCYRLTDSGSVLANMMPSYTISGILTEKIRKLLL